MFIIFTCYSPLHILRINYDLWPGARRYFPAPLRSLGIGSSPIHVGLCWIKWYWERLFTKYFGFPRQYLSYYDPYSFIYHPLQTSSAHHVVKWGIETESAVRVRVRSADLRVYIAHLPQQCHNSKSVTFHEKILKVLKCYNFSTSATTTQLLSSGEFCKLRYDTIPVQSASAKHFFFIPIT